MLLPAISLPLMAQSAGRDGFLFDAIPFQGSAPDSSRLDLLASVPYSAIGFERKDGIYVGDYHLHLKVTGNGRKWYDSTFVRTVRTRSFQTSSGLEPAFEFYQQRVMLPPGNYTATAEILPATTHSVATAEREVRTIDYRNHPVELSGLMLVSRIREDSSGFIITPMVTENISLQPDGYFVFFEVYNATTASDFTIDVSYRLAGQDAIVAGPTSTRSIPAGRSQQWIRLPGVGLAHGSYELILKLSPSSDSTKALATAARTIIVGSSTDGTPTSEGELDERISQLRYVALQSDIDQIREAPSFVERKKRYAEFWGKLDPTPGTAANEAMEEYFRRIDYANRNFRSYAAGWLTDKGHVYVVYGPPDNISADPFSNSEGRAVETWRYYGRNMNLVFVDESGFGDFRLATRIPTGDKFSYGN
jgi:GWxTD domain-containing protein